MSPGARAAAWERPLGAGPDPARVRAALGLPEPAPAAREVDLAWDVPALLRRLGDGRAVALLESTAGPRDAARFSILAWDPCCYLRAEGPVTAARRPGGQEVTLPWHLLDVLEALRGPRPCPLPELPFHGGAIGYVGYEARHWFERLPAAAPRDVGLPDAEFAYFDGALVHDGWSGRTYLVEAVPGAGAARLGALGPRPAAGEPCGVDLARAEWAVTRGAYLAAIRRAREYVFAGDAFQVCLSHRFSVPFRGPAREAYLALRAASPSPFAAYCAFPGYAILSSSPERFLRYRQGTLETRPIKGTVRRRAGAGEDAAAAASLRQDPKQQAEHLMIVDLERSDLGRVCEPGSVAVPCLARVETYSHVHHLVSTVTGRARPGVGLRAALAACFPGGSVTGAPKVRAMEIIDELECTARGAYTGSIGYVSVGGGFDLNIAIRTLVAWEGRLYGHVGGGIVADSDPEAEWRETLDKARGMLAALRALAADRTVR